MEHVETPQRGEQGQHGTARGIGGAVLLAVALLLLAFVAMVGHGIAREYGAGPGTSSLMGFLVVPLLLGVGAAGLLPVSGRARSVLVGAAVLLPLLAVPAAYAIGGAQHDDYVGYVGDDGSGEAVMACGPGRDDVWSEAFTTLPAEVRPVGGGTVGDLGCVVRLEGGREQALDAAREGFGREGWRVSPETSPTMVVAERDGVRVVVRPVAAEDAASAELSLEDF